MALLTQQAGAQLVTQGGAVIIGQPAPPPPAAAWPPDIAALRVRIGLAATDATRDADLLAAADMTLDMVETYLDRKLTKTGDSEEFFGAAKAFLLRRWPIDRTVGVQIQGRFIGAPQDLVIDWVVAGNPAGAAGGGNINQGGAFGINPSNFAIDADKGIVYSPAYAFGWPLTITYRGGFDPLPSNLMLALMLAFDAVWASDPMFGGAAGGGLIQGSGAVKKVSLVGIGSVDLDVGTTVAGGGSNGGGLSSSPWGLLPATVISMIDLYRRESAVGCG